MTRIVPMIAAVALGLGASLPLAGPASARDAGGMPGCLGEGSNQPGTWQIESGQFEDGKTFEATGSDMVPGRDGAPAGESLQSDCALV